MKKRLFLVLVLYVMNMQFAVSGVDAGANGDKDANTDTNTVELTEAQGEAVINTVTHSWSPEDKDSPEYTTEGEVDANGYQQGVKVEKRHSSTSTPLEERTLLNKVCVSSKCSPSKKSEETSGKNNQDTKKDEQASGTNRQGASANTEAEQQITNNNNNMANGAANSVVVSPPDPCIANPSLCGPPPIDPCILDPVACNLP